ncbi:hypothetical protein CCACVL1_15848 [Corchorus capsularis]|uniref:Rho termination factor-like N-terminal domain-containing protein n=1 Tax=Corchorus capsularis TaxID=210143 RepID=A0A1R3I0N3_COCAP|nr:hypothetical protein CCACVL1_15848 [Corchorus capsularis]
MAAAVLTFQSVSPFPSSFPSNQQLKLRKPALSLIEIADKSTQFCSFRLSFSSIITDGNRRGSRRTKTSVSGEKNGDESKKSFDGNTTAPNTAAQEDIIALFKRIQSSISKGETGSAKSKSLSSSKNKSTAETVLDVLRESRTTARVTRSRKGGKALRWKANVPKATQRRNEKVDAETMGFKLSRPPSYFVKRSPIPFPTAPRGMVLEQKNEVVATEDEDEGLKLAKIEKLKLPELKELAKAKGIKGYSRLKKSELIQLLRS